MKNIIEPTMETASARYALFSFYQGRLIYFWGYPALLLATLFIMLFIVQQYQPDARRLFYSIFETIFPLISSFFFVPLMLKEQQQRTLALISVSQFSLTRIFIFRLTLNCMFLFIFLLLLGICLQFAPVLPMNSAMFLENAAEIRDLTIWPSDILGGPNGVFAVMLTVGAPALLLSGWGTFFAHLSADVRVGYLMSFVLWMLNRIAGLTLDQHAYLHYVYLFVRSGGIGNWVIPKLLQIILASSLFFLSSLILVKIEWLLRER